MVIQPLDSWLPLRHHLGDGPDSGASLEYLSFSITRCPHSRDWPFYTTKKWGSFELKFDNELISAPRQQTTRNRPCSSPWLTPACGNGANILVDELYGLLTLKDSVESACVRMPFHIMPCLFSACWRILALLTTARAHLLLALKVKPRRINYLGILSFSLVSHCCALQFSPCLLSRQSPVATAVVFQEYYDSFVAAIGARHSRSGC